MPSKQNGQNLGVSAAYGGPQPDALLAPPAVTVAQGLFIEEDTSVPIGSKDATFSCNKSLLGHGTVQVAAGAGGCLHAQPHLAGFRPEAMQQTLQSFFVRPCGIVAPHVHANAAEVNTVMKGEAIIGQLTTNSHELQISHVKAGDSFVFVRGSLHWWMNLGTEELLTVGTFLNTGGPDAVVLEGVVGSLVHDAPLLNTMVGALSRDATNNVVTGGLFPTLSDGACQAARHQLGSGRVEALTLEASFQRNPEHSNLFQANELRTGMFSIDARNTPVHGPGGGLRPLAGKVYDSSTGVMGSLGAVPAFDGGVGPPNAPPPPTLWPGFTEMGGGSTVSKFVVGYCGTVNAHVHANAAEWNTVINGAGQVSYYQVKPDTPQVVVMNVSKGDSFVFPRGSVHWWVNYSPSEQLTTVGGFSVSFPDTAILGTLFQQTQIFFPALTDTLLGVGFEPSAAAVNTDLFPLLPGRRPPNCGGSVPCERCY